MNNTDAIQKAQTFVDAVRNQGILVSTASVFGSQIKGTATPISDIDVCIVSPTFGQDYIDEMIKLRKIAILIDSRIEPIPFTPEDYNDSLGTLSSEIRKHSIALQ